MKKGCLSMILILGYNVSSPSPSLSPYCLEVMGRRRVTTS